MTFKKGIWVSISSIIVVMFAAIFYLLQPSGKVSDFADWQYQAQHKNLNNTLTVKFFGTSTLLFDDGQSQILIDGFFSRPPLSQVFFQKIQSSSAQIDQVVKEQHLERVKAILVTHSHYDHALDIAELGHRIPQATIVGSPSTLNIARGGHVAETQLKQIKNFKKLYFGKFTITTIPSQHTPPTPVNNDLGEAILEPLTQPAKFSAFKEGGSFDYLIEHHGYRVLVKASTGMIPNQLKNLNVDTLFLGIAQLSKQNPRDQQEYLEHSLGALNPKVVIPIHWDNFFQALDQPLTFLPNIADNSPESLKILIKKADQQNTKVVLLTQAVAYPLSNID